MSDPQVDLAAARRALLAKQLQKARAGEKQSRSIGRRPESESIPLSFAQRRLWFLHQWEPDNPAYNVPAAWRMVGSLNATALCAALNEIVHRHQVLQMTYVTVDEDPVQVPHPELFLTLAEVDLGALPAQQRERQVQRLAVEEINRPFDLAHDLPIRTTLLHLDETEHVLLLTIHHIATDGWSMAIFIQELALLYQAFCSGQPSPLPELPIQYADFAYWQRHWLQGTVLERQMAYWKEMLAGAPEALDLPTDRPRPPVRTYKGAIHPFSLSLSLTHALRSLARQEEATLFMTLLAAFQVLLFRHTGQSDIVVGTPIANRNRPEIENLIGFFINTLAMRSDLAGNPTFKALLAQVQEMALEAYAHQDLPFEKLVDELQPGRDLSRSPIFQVMFVLQNIPMEALDLPGLTLSTVNVAHKTAKFDLALSMEDSDRGLGGAFEYNTDLFDAATIARLADHFQTLLEGIVAHPGQRLLDLPLLSEAEHDQLLLEWNHTQIEYAGEQCFHELFERQVARTPDGTAVIWQDHGLTYEALNRRANQLAHHLRKLGVGPEAPVGLCVERSLEMMVGLLGVLKAGGAYLPLSPEFPPERLAFMLEDTLAPVLLVQQELVAKLPEHAARIICLDTDWGAIAGESEANPHSNVGPENLAYILYTSGSTGTPKGVMSKQESLVNYLRWVEASLLDSSGYDLPAITTVTFDASLKQLLAPLLRGDRVWLLPEDAVMQPAILLENLYSRPQVGINCVPSLWKALLDEVAADQDAAPTERLTDLLLGGERVEESLVTASLAALPHLQMWNLYGPTETTANVSMGRLMPGEAVTIGHQIGNTQVYLLDEHWQLVPVGAPGELYVGGVGLARGYLNRPALTAEGFVPNPFAHAVPPADREDGRGGSRLYKTGDWARRLPDGRIEFLGRLDQQVKVRGFRIELGEIESILSQHPEVQEAVVLAREDKPSEKRLVAYVVPRQQPVPLVSELRNFAKEKLPDYMVPSAWVTLEALPLMLSGKVDRRALPEPEETRPALEAAFVPPRNAFEARIAAIWSEVLGLDTVGIDDNFFDLGGESFKAVKVVRRIDKSVSVMDLFKYPTIRELAAQLSQKRAERDGLLHELTRPAPLGERVISLVCIPTAGGNAVIYQPLANELPPGYALYAVELPGHDFSRPDQDLQPLKAVARQCAEEIKRDIAGPIALYGHCIGGALTIEIARLLEESNVELVGVFLGAHLPSPKRLPGKLFEWLDKLFPMRHTRGAERFHLEAARTLGGFTDTLEPEEQAFVMRNYFHDSLGGLDYYTEAYARRDGQKLKAPILSIMGQMDHATEFYEERFKEWEFFGASVDLAVIPQAGHFFVKHQPDELAQIIATQLAAWQSRAAGVPHRAADGPAASADEAVVARQIKAPSLNVFFLVALGQFISIIGTSLATFALNVWVLQQTQSVSTFALITALTWLPDILLSPIAGAVADRYDRRMVMILSDIVAACGTFFLVLFLWAGSLQIWYICVMVSIGSAANAFQRPAYAASITQLVPKRYLGHVNGIVNIGNAAGNLLAQLAGGVLVMTIGLGGVVLIDLGAFLFAVSTLWFVRFPDTLFRKQQEEPLLREVVKGWRYIIKRHGLVTMVIFFVCLNFLSSIIGVLVAPLVLSFGSPAVLGAVGTALGAGMLVGGSVMGLWGGTKRRAEGIVSFVMFFGLFAVVMGMRPSPIYPAIGLFGFGFSIAIVRSHWQALIQTKVGLELQGRVLATSSMLATAMMPLGQALAGPLADKVFEPLMVSGGALANSIGRLIGVGPGRGIGLIMILVGVIGQTWAILGYLYRPLRFMEDTLPDAIPDAVIVTDKDELQRLADRQLSAQAS